MALTPTQLEELVKWCETSGELRAARDEARRTFFGDDEPSPAQYWPETGELNQRSRRFLGWFMLDVRLPDGLQPAAGRRRKLVESCIEHGDPLPATLRTASPSEVDTRIPITIS
jgi:hypothetical protein